MNGWQMALSIGAIIAMAVAWHVPRAVHWICLGALSFVASTAYARYGFEYPAIFGAITDVAIWLVIYHYAEKRWEIAFAACFQAMIAADLIYAFGEITGAWMVSNWLRVVILEAFNWAALAVVFLTALTEPAHGVSPTRRGDARGLGALGAALHRQRKEPPFTKVK